MTGFLPGTRMIGYEGINGTIKAEIPESLPIENKHLLAGQRRVRMLYEILYDVLHLQAPAKASD